MRPLYFGCALGYDKSASSAASQRTAEKLFMLGVAFRKAGHQKRLAKEAIDKVIDGVLTAPDKKSTRVDFSKMHKEKCKNGK